MKDQLPEELRKPLINLWHMEQPIHAALLPRDMFTAIAVIQYATRNPQLSDTQRNQAIAVARAFQTALHAIDPVLDKYLELGWDSQYDTPAREAT